MKQKQTIQAKLFITFLITSLFFVSWYGWNEESNFALTRAIVEESKFEIDNYANQTGDRAIYDNHFYSDKDPGLAFLTTPIYAGWKFLYNFFPENFKEKYKGEKGYISEVLNKASVIAIVDRGFFTFTAMILVTFFTSIIFTTLTALLVFKISEYLLKGSFERIILTLTYFFGTSAFHYSLHFMNHATATFFLFLSFFILFKRKSDLKRFILSGIFFGFSVVVDKLLILFFPIILAYSFTLNKKFFISFFLFTIVSTLPYVFYNYVIFKNPFEFASTYIDREIYKYAYPLQNISSEEKISKASFFDLENLIYKLHLRGLIINPIIMLRLLFYPYRGLFFYSPILILSLAGLYFMWKKYKKESFTIISMLFLLTSAISTRAIWWGGLSFGSRYLLPLVPFLMLPLAFSLKKFGIKIFLIFLLISIFINFLGLQPAEEMAYDWSKRDVKKEWLEKQNTFEIIYNPLVEHYLPLFLKYGPRSSIFEHLTNGYISIDIRSYPLSKGPFFPFSKFFVPFLCLVPLVLILAFIWYGSMFIKKLKHLIK